MACPACNATVVFGGKKHGSQRFCVQKCFDNYQAALSADIASDQEVEEVEEVEGVEGVEGVEEAEKVEDVVGAEKVEDVVGVEKVEDVAGVEKVVEMPPQPAEPEPIAVAHLFKKFGWAGLASITELYGVLRHDRITVHWRSAIGMLGELAGLIPGLGAVLCLVVTQYGGLFGSRSKKEVTVTEDFQYETIPLSDLSKITFVERHPGIHGILKVLKWIAFADVLYVYSGHAIITFHFTKDSSKKTLKLLASDLNEARQFIAAIEDAVGQERIERISTTRVRGTFETMVNGFVVCAIPGVLTIPFTGERSLLGPVIVMGTVIAGGLLSGLCFLIASGKSQSS